MQKISFIISVIFLSTVTTVTTFDWQIKDGFTVRFSGTKVDGNFEEIEGTIAFDENDLSTAQFDLQIKVESIATGNWLMNRHAKGDNWFDAKKYLQKALELTK